MKPTLPYCQLSTYDTRTKQVLSDQIEALKALSKAAMELLASRLGSPNGNGATL